VSAAAPAEAPGRALARDLMAALGVDAVRRLAPGGAAAVYAAADRRIAAIDRLLTDQVNAILHHERFQALEAAWRGLAYLVTAAPRGSRLRIKILPVSWRELARDIERADDIENSAIFTRIHTNEFDMPGGEPFGLLVGAYAVQHRPRANGVDDIATLRGLARVGSAAFAPVVVGAEPGLLGLTSFRDLGPDVDLDRIVRQRAYTRWHALQAEADARFLGVALPPILLRTPYREGERGDGFRFAERVREGGPDGHLWGNPAFAFAAVVARCFAETGWFADIRGAPRGEARGGLVTGLPAPDAALDGPGGMHRQPVAISLSETQEHALARLGFVTLVANPFTPYAAFHATPSVWRPEGDAGTRLAGMLHYLLCVSRFAHVIKILGREMLGKYTTTAECEERLQAWLAAYTVAPLDGQDDAALLARYPLRSADVRVREHPGRPGAYRCTLALQPQHQIDHLIGGFQVTTELARAGSA